MRITVAPSVPEGLIEAIPSKSQAHRLLICAALSKGKTQIACKSPSEDILATARCLRALGAEITLDNDAFFVTPTSGERLVKNAVLDCGESGTTYRLLAPLACTLSKNATFLLSGRLPLRPMESLWKALEKQGISVIGKGTASPSVSGVMKPGRYDVPGDISSQFVSGLLLTLPNLEGESGIALRGEAVSRGYIDMTLAALDKFGVKIINTEYGFLVPGKQEFTSPGTIAVEGDWSNSAFWLCAAATGGGGITVSGLSADSLQGDRSVCDLLRLFGAHVVISGNCVTVAPGELHGICISAENIPDLVPALAVTAVGASGETVIRDAGRLRMKESNRITAICDVIQLLGGHAATSGDTLTIQGGGKLRGGVVDSHGDHRIAMMAAAMAAMCKSDVTIENAHAVGKSYPTFFEDYNKLTGCVREGE